MNEKELLKRIQSEVDVAMNEYKKREKELHPDSDKLVSDYDETDQKCVFLYGYATGLTRAIEMIKESENEN